MPSAAQRIRCLQGDITAQGVDAIVNAANERLRGGGGVDGAIHRAAGPGLLAELVERYPHGCATGEVRETGGHGLAARFVLHAVGPVWRGGDAGEPELLAACYRSAVELAARLGCRTVAFPAISTGVFGYPAEAAAPVALATIAQTLELHPTIEEARMVLFGAEALAVHREVLDTLDRG